MKKKTGSEASGINPRRESFSGRGDGAAVRPEAQRDPYVSGDAPCPVPAVTRPWTDPGPGARLSACRWPTAFTS